MKLSDLDGREAPTIVLLQTSSVRLGLYLRDKMKLKLHCAPEEIIDLATKDDYARVRQLTGIVPLNAERWLVFVDLDKADSKALDKLIKQSSTCCFFCTCSKYGTFKKFKESVKDMNGVLDFYIQYLRKNDLLYLHDAFTTSDNRLTKAMFDFVSQSYASDIDSVFDLLTHLNQGEKFLTRKSIQEVCGVGGHSIESYIFALLKPLSGSALGFKTTIRNRLKYGLDLGDSLKYVTLYNFMSRSLLLFCELKMLMISGKVYKRISHLPDFFDEKALARYQKYIWRLRDIPMSDLLKLRLAMGTATWKSEIDLISFIYRYYSLRGKELCP